MFSKHRPFPLLQINFVQSSGIIMHSILDSSRSKQCLPIEMRFYLRHEIVNVNIATRRPVHFPRASFLGHDELVGVAVVSSSIVQNAQTASKKTLHISPNSIISLPALYFNLDRGT